ncbi:AzlD domain-containing protein [Cognatishimia activa]|uniref:AzlD domain-containing protein n=1 Tax=Cognatishimia activa TaxID=1715691 RepID=A0A975I852_9RHOB|nr:AzlD domain-containing protein [Cognatishimia activa]QTN36669.1 AzlD domain-containing protein [Cognatishimia activa]
MSEHPDLWLIIVALGLGSFGLRFMFTGLLGSWSMPAIILRHLRYAAVAVLPGLVAPLVLWPSTTDGQIDPARLTAAVVTLGVAMIFKRVLLAIVTGAGTLFLMLYLIA